MIISIFRIIDMANNTVQVQGIRIQQTILPYQKILSFKILDDCKTVEAKLLKFNKLYQAKTFGTCIYYLLIK